MFHSLSAKKVFDEFCGRASKRFGQNYLFDEKINRKIVSVAGDLFGKTVLEIGPGPGGLTLEILKANINKLYVVEYDENWVNVWRRLKEDYFHEKIDIIHSDALDFDLKSVSPDIVISNLPYNISTELLFKWLPEFHLYEKFVLMFQKEVAERLYASASTKAYGKLSVLSQWKSDVSKAFDLEPGSFFPAPKVKSTVVKFVPKPICDTFDKFDLLSRMLSSAFAQRRKVVSKQLKTFFDDPQIVLEQIGYNSNARAENILVSDYVKLVDFYRNSFCNA